MTGRKFAKGLVAAALSAAVVFLAPIGRVPASADSLSELQQKQSDLKKQGQDLDSQLQTLKNDKARQEQYRATLEAKSVNLENQIDGKNIEIQELDARIEQLGKEIAAKEKEIDADFDKLKKRVCALYVTGERSSSIEVILNAKNMMDLEDKTEMLKAISKHDTGLIDNLKADQKSIAAQKTQIEKDRKASGDARTSLEQDQQQLTSLAQEVTKMLATLEQKEQNVQGQQANVQTAQAATQNAIGQWFGKYRPFNAAKNPATTASSGQISRLLSVAQQYSGVPYVYGGSSPTGFDCSGFVSYVMQQSGWNVPRMGVGGLSNYTTPVSDPAPGDLVFYNGYDHVGIYLGGGQAIQCDTTGGVKTVTLSKYWHDHIDSYGRLP